MDGSVITLRLYQNGTGCAILYRQNSKATEIQRNTVRWTYEEEKGASTVLYSLPLTGGEAEKAYEFPLDASNFKRLLGGNLLITTQAMKTSVFTTRDAFH